MSLAQDIKEVALDTGYNHVGITSSDDFADHIKEIQSRGAIYDLIGCEIGTVIFVPEGHTADRAGVTAFGKNNFAYARGTGSLILLSSIVVDKELEYDAPMNDIKCPQDCIACMDACP